MKKIRNYHIIKQLGEGGMGSVYLAEEELTERKVAIKVLHPQLTNNPQFKDRFIREAKALVRLKHPNIVNLLTLFEESGSYYMVLEYFEGETLKEMIRRRGPIPEEEVKEIAKQILDAVGHAHEADIVHRDIKPSNIIIDKNSKVGILDFGIAKMLADADYTRTGTMLGTLYYMSPEQIKGEKNIDHRTDIYSIGVTLYEMLAGRLPFETKTEISEFTRSEITIKIVNEDFPDPREYYPHISDEIISVVKKMISRVKGDRISNCKNCVDLIYGKGLDPDNKAPVVEFPILNDKTNEKQKEQNKKLKKEKVIEELNQDIKELNKELEPVNIKKRIFAGIIDNILYVGVLAYFVGFFLSSLQILGFEYSEGTHPLLPILKLFFYYDDYGYESIYSWLTKYTIYYHEVTYLYPIAIFSSIINLSFNFLRKQSIGGKIFGIIIIDKKKNTISISKLFLRTLLGNIVAVISIFILVSRYMIYTYNDQKSLLLQNSIFIEGFPNFSDFSFYLQLCLCYIGVIIFVVEFIRTIKGKERIIDKLLNTKIVNTSEIKNNKSC